MTIKGYVLDALQKFWNKLKTTYVTDCVTDDDNLALAASQGKALNTNKLNKSGDQVLTLSGTIPRVSVQATNISGRFVASDNSDLLGIWDESKNNWVISRNTSGVTHLPGYWTHSTAGSGAGLFKESWTNADGFAVVNMRVTINVAVNAPSGGIYYAYSTLPDFPITFAEKPTVLYSTEVSGGANNAWVWGRSTPTTTNPGSVFIGRGPSTAARDYIINVHAFGRIATS